MLDLVDAGSKGDLILELIEKRLGQLVHPTLEPLHLSLLAVRVAGEESVLERLDEAVLKYDVGVAQVVELDGGLALPCLCLQE